MKHKTTHAEFLAELDAIKNNPKSKRYLIMMAIICALFGIFVIVAVLFHHNYLAIGILVVMPLLLCLRRK